MRQTQLTPAAFIISRSLAASHKATISLDFTSNFWANSLKPLALGDAANDLEMMKAAGFSIAMGNAAEDIKKIADAITSSNDEAGVAEAIQKYVLKTKE